MTGYESLAFMDATALAQLVREHAVTPRELVDFSLAASKN